MRNIKRASSGREADFLHCILEECIRIRGLKSGYDYWEGRATSSL